MNLTAPSKPRFYLSDGGLEAWLLYTKKIPLREFAAFELHQTSKGEEVLWEYFRPFIELAVQVEAGFIFTACTWRVCRLYFEGFSVFSFHLLPTVHRGICCLCEHINKH